MKIKSEIIYILIQFITIKSLFLAIYVVFFQRMIQMEKI